VRHAKALKQFCHSLDGLQASIATYAEGIDEFLLSHGYPADYKRIEAIREGLEDLGLYEEVLEAVKKSEMLVRQGRYQDAELLVLEANRKLSKASGADEDLRRTYKASNG